MSHHRTRVPARWRDYYNDALRGPALLNTWHWRLRYALFGFRHAPPVLVNLGSGKDYRPGYINVDVNLAFKRDVWADLRNPLPFPSDSIDGIFCSHVLEHFALDEVRTILRECQRILLAGAGVLRVAVPDFVPAIKAYLEGDRSYFHGAGRSLGRLFSDHLLDNSNHKQLFDGDFVEELLTDTGFAEVRRARYREGSWPLSQRLSELDNRQDITVFVDARR
jgi:SAM-dependent methyltransferase